MAEVTGERVDRILRRWRAVEDRKGLWDQHWEDLSRIMLPRRMGFVSETGEGDRRTEDIFDGTAMRAARGLANSVSQMLRPEGEQWFFMRPADDDLDNVGEVQDWLAESEDKLQTALFNPKARYRQAAGEADLDLVVLGTAVKFTGRAKAMNHLTFRSLSLNHTAIGYDDEGNPDTLFMTRRYTLRQAEEKFGRDALGETSREKLASGNEKGLEEKIRFLQAVLPRPEGRQEAVLARNLPVAEVWIEIDAKKIVSEGGFHEFPFSVSRWDTSSGEDYGRSPAMIALPDAATLQAMGETILVAGQRAADPPLFAPNDGSFDAANTFPGGISYYDVDTAISMGGNPFFPLESAHNLPITRDMQGDVREQVEAAFFRNVFNLPVQGPDMTATEVIERKEEFIREIGPVFGRLESDHVAPDIERAFMIMLRSGSFDPIPEVLQGRDIRFEFESPVKKIREQAEAAAARLWAQEQLVLAEAKPGALDLIDEDELGRFAAEALNLPHRIVASREAVASMREARAAAEQEAAERERVAQEAQIAQAGSQAMKNVVEGSPQV